MSQQPIFRVPTLAFVHKLTLHLFCWFDIFCGWSLSGFEISTYSPRQFKPIGLVEIQLK